MITYRGKTNPKTISFNQDKPNLRMNKVLKFLKENGRNNIDILDIIITSKLEQRWVTENHCHQEKEVLVYIVNIIYVEREEL